MSDEQGSKTVLELLKREDGEDAALGVTADMLERADLSLPPEFALDSMAAEMVEHLSAYHRPRVALKAARAQGDGQRADQLFKTMAFSRLAAALMQNEYPGIKAVADLIARARVKQVQAQRQALLDANEVGD